MSDHIKKPNKKSEYTEKQLFDLDSCQDDPFYFIEKFIKVQHVKKGSVPLILYPFQRDLINAFHTHSKVIALTARQMGKSLTSTSKITVDGNKVNIINSMKSLGLLEKIIDFLEKVQIKLARSR